MKNKSLTIVFCIVYCNVYFLNASEPTNPKAALVANINKHLKTCADSIAQVEPISPTSTASLSKAIDALCKDIPALLINNFPRIIKYQQTTTEIEKGKMTPEQAQLQAEIDALKKYQEDTQRRETENIENAIAQSFTLFFKGLREILSDIGNAIPGTEKNEDGTFKLTTGKPSKPSDEQQHNFDRAKKRFQIYLETIGVILTEILDKNALPKQTTVFYKDQANYLNLERDIFTNLKQDKTAIASINGLLKNVSDPKLFFLERAMWKKHKP